MRAGSMEGHCDGVKPEAGRTRDTPKRVGDPLPCAPRLDARSTMLKVEEVADRWDLNVKTVYGMIERGELSARRCGRVIRVPRHIVESFEQASVTPERTNKSCR